MQQVLYFLIFMSVSVLIYWLLPWRKRSIFLVGASLVFMCFLSPKYAVYLFFNSLLIYIAGSYVSRDEKNRKLFLQLSLFWLIGNLCIFKYINSLLDALSRLGISLPFMNETTFSKIIMPLGMSYVIFRLIHYIVEIYRKTLPKHTFWDLALYTFFFPTFLAGPVDRFQKVQPQTAECKSFDPSDFNYGLFRMISGMIKKFVVADSIKKYIMPLLLSPQDVSPVLVTFSVYALAIQIYMDFSGYTDMALGVSRLFGYKIVENFNNPYLKKNIALFWRNWHMSVYSFIRDYFFFPFFGYRASQAKIYIGIFSTMVIFMLWHEGSLPFLLLGVYHGSGLLIWQFFQEIKKKHAKIRKLVDNPYADPFSTLVTFTFVSFGYILFAFDMSTVKAIVYQII